MQQERPPIFVCIECGYQNPGNYCPNCGAEQFKGRRRSSFPWGLVLAIGVVAAGFVLTLVIIGGTDSGYDNGGYPTGSFPRITWTEPTPTPIPPVHTLVTCREIADEATLKHDFIRKITHLRVNFRGQDRMECSGWVDVEWAEDEWVTLGAARDYEGKIRIFLDWD